MCGIAAVAGGGPAATRVRLALERLEYRGYDSAGIAARTPAGDVHRARTLAGVASLAEHFGTAATDATTAAIGHTRWATHGGVSQRNAHPIADCGGELFLVHNGIVENADLLRPQLIAGGHRFTTDVDSEVIVHLLEDVRRPGRALVDALAEAVRALTGSWAVVALDAVTGEIAGTACGSPLVAAHDRSGLTLSSDVGAIAADVGAYRVLEDGDAVGLGPRGLEWARGGRRVDAPPERPVPATALLASTGVHADHMGNEIDEQPLVARRVLDALSPGIADGGLWRGLGLPPLAAIDRVAVLGCGTSLHAGRAIGGTFSALGGLPVHSLVASEAAHTVWEPHTLVIAISQSGETADVLRALDTVPPGRATVLALTNNTASSLARRSDAVIDCLAGPEIGVAATKTFVAQVLTGVCVALSGLGASRLGAPAALEAHLDALARTPDTLAAALGAWGEVVPRLVTEFSPTSGFLFLGRGPGLVYAAEGALKLKELSYRWAEHQPAGELKHGPLALVDAGTPVFVVDSGDPRLQVDIAEVSAPGGRVVRVGTAAAPSSPIAGGAVLPAWGPLDAVVPLQMFARDLALRLGRDVDKPRNLAKSVTVQ